MKKIYCAPFQLKGKATGEFSAQFASLNVIDLDHDVTLPGAFQNGQEVLIEPWNHNYGDLPVGKGVIHEEGRKAIIEGQFFLDTQSGREHYQVVKNLGSLQQWSYTFEVVKARPGIFEGQNVQFLEKLDVWGVAPVARGAGIDTRTTSIKNADRGRIWMPSGSISPKGMTAIINSLVPPSIMLAELDEMLSEQQFKELANLQARVGAGGPSLLEAWRAALIAEGHSQSWIEVVIGSEIGRLERAILEGNPYLTPAAACAEAMRLLNQQMIPNTIFPEPGAQVRSTLSYSA